MRRLRTGIPDLDLILGGGLEPGSLVMPHMKLVRHLEPFDFFKAAALGKSVDFIHLGELVAEAGNAGLEPIVTEVVIPVPQCDHAPLPRNRFGTPAGAE